MAKMRWRAVGAATIALFLCMGCTSGGDESLSAQATLSLNPYGEWIWTLTDPFGCPTAVEKDFPFLDLDNKRFEVFDTGKGGLGAEFEDSAGNLVEMEGTFNESTGLVDVTFCITERPPIILTGDTAQVVCEDAFGYVTDPALGMVLAFDLEDTSQTAQQPIQVTGAFNDPRDMGASPDGAYVLVPNYGNDTVSVIETATHNVVQTLAGGSFSQPTSAAFHPSVSRAYVLNSPIGSDSIDQAYIRVIDTTSVPFQTLGDVQLQLATPTGLAMDPTGDWLIALFNNGTMSVMSVATDGSLTVTNATEATISGACQGAFTPNGSQLVVVGVGGMALYDSSVFVTPTAPFQSFPIPGWDVAITTDGARAYITAGDKVSIVSGSPGLDPIRCFNLATNQEETGVDLQAPYGIDTCDGHAFVAQTFRGAAFNTPAHETWSFAPFEVGRFARIAQRTEPPFQPRIIKIQFTAQLTFLDNMRQLDGISQIIDIIGFQFACQTVVSENTWVFIQDLVG